MTYYITEKDIKNECANILLEDKCVLSIIDEEPWFKLITEYKKKNIDK